MSKNYLSVERNGKCIDHVMIQASNEELVFADIVNMSYDEIKSYEHIDELVVCIMDATNYHFKDKQDNDTIVTLVDKNDVFIWSILIGPVNEDEIKYVFIDWKKDGKKYKYSS